jgi:hypothetical protein
MLSQLKNMGKYLLNPDRLQENARLAEGRRQPGRWLARRRGHRGLPDNKQAASVEGGLCRDNGTNLCTPPTFHLPIRCERR